MKIQNILLILTTFILCACGSTESVIADDGKIYEIKGNTFKNGGVDVTDQLTADEKANINNKLKEKIELREAAEKRQNELEKQQKELEKAQREAKKKQEELEDLQKELERKQKVKKEARDNYIKAQKDLKRQQSKYERLKEKGKLSPRDEADWKEKLTKLEDEVTAAKKVLDEI